jgi:hypothetical protein
MKAALFFKFESGQVRTYIIALRAGHSSNKKIYKESSETGIPAHSH